MAAHNRTAQWAALLILAGSAAASRAGDWPQWGGDNGRNMASAERNLPDAFDLGGKRDSAPAAPASAPADGEVLWSARLGSQTYGNPVVAGGRVFVGTNDASLADPRLKKSDGGLVLCLDEATGKTLWQLPIPRFQTDLKRFNFDRLKLGVCSSPTVAGDRVYVVSNRGEVLCLDVRGQADGNDGPYKDEGQFMAGPGKPPVELTGADPDIIWLFDMIAQVPSWPQDAVDSAVLVCGDVLYVGTSNGVDSSHRNVPHPEAPSLIALDRRTGRLLGADDRKIGTRLFHGQWSSPALGVVGGRPLVLFGGGDGVCYAFDAAKPPAPADGRPAVLPLTWSFDCNPPEYRCKDGKPIRYRTPAGPSEIIATPVFHGGRVYVAIGQDPRHSKGKGALSCIDPTGRGDLSGKAALWVNQDIDRSLSTVSIGDGLLYVADFSGILHCLDADTGKTLWTHDLESPVWSSTLLADGKVYIGTEKRDLWILAAGRDKRLIRRIPLPEPMYSTPLAANGVLYLATQKHLFAVRRKAGG